MATSEIRNYTALNELAETNGTVIFGGTKDKEIPLCELKQAFSLSSNLYNRSITNLSVNNAVDVYNACVADLHPAILLLHIGQADLTLFEENTSSFDLKYRELITHIKNTTKNCTIGIISLQNFEKSDVIANMNKHLKYIAESEHCDFEDISSRRVWNPKETKDVVSFIYSTGFVHPLKGKRSIYDLVKILFCSLAAE